jgi:TonB family protein
MLTLVIQQTLSNGVKKVWKLRPDTGTKTFGSSRLADVISIDPLAKGIQGVFEYRENQWFFTDLDRAHVSSDKNPTFKIGNKTTLNLDGSTLELEIFAKEITVFSNVDKVVSKNTDGLTYKLYVVKANGAVVETRVLNPGETYESPLKGAPGVTIHEKELKLEDVKNLAQLNSKDYFDKDSRKGAYIMMAAALMIIGVGVFTPKAEPIAQVVPPKATKVVVMTDALRKKKGLEAKKPEPQKPQQTAQAPKPSPAPAAGGKVSGALKSFSAGRISQMLGKVSAQAAKTENVIVTVSGVKAAPGEGGRALAAIGPVSRAGKDWSSDAKGTGGGVSTAGRGGGKGSGSFGSLSGGNTGNAGVGLIEDESEVVGGLDRDIIAQYIKTQLGQILYCYERQLSAHPELEGKVAVRFTIGPSGKVETQKIGDTTLRNATVEGCILSRVAQWKFPTPQGGTSVNVTYPFLFKSTN